MSDLASQGGFEEQQDDPQYELATALIVRLATLDQSLRLYGLKNEVVVKTLEEVSEAASSFHRLTGEDMQLTLAGFSFFVNRRLIRMDFNTYRKAETLKRLWDRIGMGTLVIKCDASVEELTEFVSSWLRAVHEPEQAASFFTREMQCFVVGKAVSESRATVNVAEHLVRTYCALVVLMRVGSGAFAEGKGISILRVKRSLQVIVDHLDGYRGLLLSLAFKPELRGDLAAHLVSTAVVAMVIGRGFGLDRRILMTLGMTALLHDLPKAGLKDGTLNSIECPTEMAAEDRDRVAQHWLSRVRQFLAQSGLSEELLARVVVMYESQLEFSNQKLYGRDNEELSLLSSLVALADKIDTLTWARPGKGVYLHHHAVCALLADAVTGSPNGRQVAASLGVYPPGSAVRLVGGEIAIVKDRSPTGDPMRPIVEIVADASGLPVESSDIDLVRQREMAIQGPIALHKLPINTVACFGDLAPKT